MILQFIEARLMGLSLSANGSQVNGVVDPMLMASELMGFTVTVTCGYCLSVFLDNK